MPEIKWDLPGTHYFEAGVDHGVLYVYDTEAGAYKNGVAWNGLTSVTESPEGAEPNAIYADNIKYLTLMSVEEFKATIEAYTYPEEFEACDGSAELLAGAGVYVGQQTRVPFALSYRTRIGNDENPEKGYKIHIIYGCLASPSERAHETINDSPDATAMSWEVSTTPVECAGFKPISHLVIDTTKVTAAKLKNITEKLYGTTTGQPTLMLPDEILTELKKTN